MHRARAYFAGMAVLLGLLAVVAEPGHAPLLIGVALAASLLVVSAFHLLLPTAVTRADVGPHRARAPGVILTSTHPDAAGRPRPRAPGATPVALA
jgi:hypothetical protein